MNELNLVNPVNPVYQLMNFHRFRVPHRIRVLPRVACPIFAFQGEDDEYFTMRQVERIAESVHDVEWITLENCGHLPHAISRRPRPA